MPAYALAARAATPMIATVRGIAADQLDAATPCRAYDVRKLLNHLLFWGPSLAGAATDAGVAPPAASEPEVDLTGGDWAGAMVDQIDRTATAWGEPAAWQGSTRMGGPDPLPASMIGGMVLTELVVHGWDLARATGQQPQWEGEVLEFVHQQVAQTAEQGRELGVYGPRVAVPDTAGVLDRILGLTGRDPGWPGG